MPAKQFFLSCVSAEFKSYREKLRHDLARPDVTVKVQGDFAAFGTETLCKLDAYIQHCDCVVHIVGDMTGAMAGQAAVKALLRSHPDLWEHLPPLRALLDLPDAALPYTQWEAWLALYHGKPLLIACPTHEAPRDEGAVDDPAQRALQWAHLERLAAVQRHPEIHFANADRLAVEVLRSPAGPGAVSATLRIHELPQRNPNFSGRDNWIEQLRSSLGSGKPVVVAQAIVGLGGIGKTQLALEYAHRHAQAYDLVWWVRAESLTLRDEDLLTLHRRMGLPAPEGETPRERLATLRRALEATARWLLVFDNVEQPEILQDILPRVGGGHVLITSRLRDWQALAREVQLPVWSPVEALQYLVQRTGQPADPALVAIAEDLGHLPLALEQAAAYMVNAAVSAARYRSLLQRTRLEPLDVQGASAIASIWDVSIRAVRARSPGALTLLEFLSFMPPDDISRSALLGGASIPMPARLAGVLRDELSLNDAVAVLRGFSLVDAAQDRLQIHRLVQLVVSHRLKAKDYRAYAETARRFQPGWVLEAPRASRPPARWRVQAAAVVSAVAIVGIGVTLWHQRHDAAPSGAEAPEPNEQKSAPATPDEGVGPVPSARANADALNFGGLIATLAADRLKGTHAADKLNATLAGLSLQNAMNWVDCARVLRLSGSEVLYNGDRSSATCAPFENTGSAIALANFVKRNPNYLNYPYTAIAIQRQAYEPGHRGARRDDVVAALGAAIALLQHRVSADREPVNIVGEREAVLLLVHLVADLHRPLHVGAIYLDAQGRQVDPDSGAYDPATDTAGANRLRTAGSGSAAPSNLHAIWDQAPRREVSMSALQAAARAVPRTSGPVEGWPAQWATESLQAAQAAFEGISIGPRDDRGWPVVLPPGYLDRMEVIKLAQLSRGGSHLAHLLTAIWP